MTASLSVSLTLTKTLPRLGNGGGAAICDLAYARPRSTSMPITSPVDFISGPSEISRPSYRRNGNTASFTEKCLGTISFVKPSSCNCRSEEHTSELQSLRHLVCRLLLEKKKTKKNKD